VVRADRKQAQLDFIVSKNQVQTLASARRPIHSTPIRRKRLPATTPSVRNRHGRPGSAVDVGGDHGPSLGQPANSARQIWKLRRLIDVELIRGLRYLSADSWRAGVDAFRSSRRTRLAEARNGNRSMIKSPSGRTLGGRMTATCGGRSPAGKTLEALLRSGSVTRKPRQGSKPDNPPGSNAAMSIAARAAVAQPMI
jgi:hypothetical protein